MRRLHHHPLCPFSRKVRLCLGEKRLDAELIEEKPWERPPHLLALNPAGNLPVLCEAENGPTVADAQAIAEYLDEAHPDPGLLGPDPKARAEARRLTAWFDHKFFDEVTRHLWGQKLWSRLAGGPPPDSRVLRAGKANIHTHLTYIAWLAERRRWLAGNSLSLADLAAAAQLSVIDYSGDVPWNDHPLAKDWYARLKSRPAFRPLLADTAPGITPPPHYADLDF
ncbi:glutathione S-transferase family protein [Roseospirillum parvum]|uniref:Glutathione S-transferase n=1 Tax=Roseospirillum parvum TaxID=83401 RepID=A0A1G7TM98_9PROT|nr:glutathione S-transferase family protein [Roseospirillum parvum]SDG36448.1 glutathione S-transferase [Roseospirillum parvum]